MFGIETDAEIDAWAEERKKQAWQKRFEIIDSDIFRYTRDYTMLDRMATQPTIQAKKQFIVDYLKQEIAKDRVPGANRIVHEPQYDNKPVDENMLWKFADYIIDHYKHEDGVKYFKKYLSDGTYTYLDANGNSVYRQNWAWNKFCKDHELELAQELYPREDYPDMYSRSGNEFWSHELPDQQRAEFRDELRRRFEETDDYVEIVPLI